jgi:hypothetical protein
MPKGLFPACAIRDHLRVRGQPDAREQYDSSRNTKDGDVQRKWQRRESGSIVRQRCVITGDVPDVYRT